MVACSLTLTGTVLQVRRLVGVTFGKILHPCVSGALPAEVSLSQLVHIQRIQVWSVDLVINLWHTHSVVVPVKVPTQGASSCSGANSWHPAGGKEAGGGGGGAEAFRRGGRTIACSAKL